MLYGKLENNQITQTYGSNNVEFSPTVFQQARTLTAEQRQEFGVVEIARTPQPAHDAKTQTVKQGDYALVNGAWTETWVVTTLPLAEAKARYHAEINSIKQSKMTGTITVSGLEIGLDADSKGLMALGKTNNRTTRKIHTQAGTRAVLTGAQFDGLIATIENFGQLVMDRAYDLSEAVESAVDISALTAIDISSGWPE